MTTDRFETEKPFDFPFHPLAEMFPLMEGQGLDELANDIKRNGIREAITVHQNKILDGRNRIRAGKKVGHVFVRQNFRELRCDIEAQAYVVSANIHRRHLNQEQRREIIAKLLKADPAKSNRQIAETAKASHVTVGDVRKELESTGQIDQLDATTGADGKTRKRKGGKPKGKGSGSAKTTITYQEVVNAKTALNAYSVLEEHLLDALQDVNDKSDFSQAEDYGRATMEKLEEKLAQLQPADEEAA